MMMTMVMMTMMITRMVDDMRTEEMSIRTMFGVIPTLCRDVPYAVLYGYGTCWAMAGAIHICYGVTQTIIPPHSCTYPTTHTSTVKSTHNMKICTKCTFTQGSAYLLILLILGLL